MWQEVVLPTNKQYHSMSHNYILHLKSSKTVPFCFNFIGNPCYIISSTEASSKCPSVYVFASVLARVAISRFRVCGKIVLRMTVMPKLHWEIRPARGEYQDIVRSFNYCIPNKFLTMAFRSVIARPLWYAARACKRSPQVLGGSWRLCSAKSSLDEPGMSR